MVPNLKKVLVFANLITGLYLSQGCESSISTVQLFKLELIGSYQKPSTASGNAAPKFIEMKLKSVQLTNKSTGDVIELVTEEQDSKKIVSRSQLIFSSDISDYDSQTFSKVEITFEEAATVGGNYDTYDLTLASTKLSKEKDIKVEEGKGIKSEVEVKWQNIITRDETEETESVSSPEFEITVESN